MKYLQTHKNKHASIIFWPHLDETTAGGSRVDIFPDLLSKYTAAKTK